MLNSLKLVHVINSNTKKVTKMIWIMSSYAHFATPTCTVGKSRCRVCKIAEDWRQQQSSALVKWQQQRSTTPLLSPVSRIASMHCFNAQPSNYKLNTLVYKWACQSGRNCLLFIIIHDRTKSILPWQQRCGTGVIRAGQLIVRTKNVVIGAALA